MHQRHWELPHPIVILLAEAAINHRCKRGKLGGLPVAANTELQ